MNEQQLLAYLGELNARLWGDDFIDFLISLPDDPRVELNALRRRLTVLYKDLTNHRLAVISGRLDAIADDFATGRRSLDAAIDEMNDAAKLAQTLARVADLAAKVVMAV